MAQIFISYSRRDKDFVQNLVAVLISKKREVWLDQTNIEPTAEWMKEIFANIETSDNFVFVISPDSVISGYVRKEIDHAVLNNKRIIPILYRPVPDKDIPEAVAKIQRIDFCGDDGLDAKVARLICAVDTDLEWTQYHTRLLTRATEWGRNGKDSSFLLRGKDLREAELQLATNAGKEPHSTTIHSQYVLASRRAASERQRIVIGAVLIAFLIAVGLAIYAFREKNLAQRNAQESQGRELAIDATQSVGDDLERSILLAMYAVNATLQFGNPPVPAAEQALHHAILLSQVRLTLRGHEQKVTGVAYSPDGTRLATTDGTPTVWDAVTGKKVLTLPSQGDMVVTVTYSPDGKRLAAGGWHTIKVWDAITGHELLSWHGHEEEVTGIAYSSDGRSLTTVSLDQTAKVWDAITGRQILSLTSPGPNGSLLGVAYSPDGKRVAIASIDGIASVFDAVSGKLLLTLRGHTDNVSSVAFSPDGTRLVTTSGDHTAKVWDAITGRELLTFRGHSAPVHAVAYSPDGRRLVTCDDDATVMVWDAVSGQQLLTLLGHTRNVSAVAYSPDGKHVATASDDRTVKVWDAIGGEELVALLPHADDTYRMAYSHDGSRLATISIASGAKIWDVGAGRQLFTLRDGDSAGVTFKGFSSVTFSRDDRRLATASGDSVYLWDADSGQLLRTLSGHTKTVLSVAFSPDGSRLVTTSSDQTAKVWDAVTGRDLLTLKVDNSGEVNAAVYSPDGSQLVTWTDDEMVRMWNAFTGQVLFTRRVEYVSNVVFSPDGKRFATSALAETKVWDAFNGRELLTLSGKTSFYTYAAYSPDGRQLATVNADIVKVWDATNGRELLALTGHIGNVNGIAYSPDGRLLATCGQDATVRLWNANSGQQVLTLQGNAEPGNYVTYGPTGKNIAVTSNDGSLRVYTLDIRQLLDLARNRVTRAPPNLTSEECQRYLQSEECPQLP